MAERGANPGWDDPFSQETSSYLKTRDKIYTSVEKLGVAVLFGIPLPDSGVYSGALGAYLLGVDRKTFFI